MRVSLLIRWLIAAAACSAVRMASQPTDPPVGVAVRIIAQTIVDRPGDTSVIWLSGNFLPSSPTANDGYDNRGTSYAVSGWRFGLAMGDYSYVRVEPEKTYTIYANSYHNSDSSGCPAEIDILAPPGYQVVMSNKLRTRETFTGATTIDFQLLPLKGRHPGLAGMASSLTSSEIDWRVSLGSLRNGGSAGDIALIDTGQRNDWSAIFTPASLYYQPLSDEVAIYEPNNILRQVLANQVGIDIVTLSSTSYEIRCYHPSQVQGTSFPRSFTGSAFATYRVEQGATGTTLKITREIRDVTDSTSTFVVARRDVMTLARTGQWPTANWSRTEWTLDGQTPLIQTDVTGSGTTSNRSESIAVRVPGSSPTINLSRNFTVPLHNNLPVLGEVLVSETLGSTNGLNATFNYYTDPSQGNSFGHVQSAILPGGRWVAFDYYDDPMGWTTAPPVTLGSSPPAGRVRRSYRPFVNYPATATQNTSQGEVVSYTYVNDAFSAPTRVAQAETAINGTVTARTTTSYDDNFGTANGFALTQVTRTGHAGASGTLVSVTKYYREDIADAFVCRQTYSVTEPDGVKKSFAYRLGTWDGTEFTPEGSGIGTGTASRIAVITGSSNSAAGAAQSDVDGCTIDTVYLVDGKSTKEVTIRDSRALVVRTESHTWKNNAWQLVSYTTLAYDFAGRLTSRISSNGATYTATYSGGLKTSETDAAGVITTLSYDAAGRVQETTRAGSGVVGALTTRFTYDAAGAVTKEEIGYGQSNPITTERQFDDAGRVVSLTPPGGYGAETYTYNVTNRTQATTRADGTTIITTDHLDGRRQSVTGTGTIHEHHTYGVETSSGVSGQRWHLVNTGTISSPRWNKRWQDWLGREIKTEQPGFTGQQNVVTEKFYESGTGRLTKTTQTGYAATLYQYNVLGQVIRSGLDYDNSGTLDLAGSDRITDADSYLESYGGAWWIRTDTKTYPKLGLNTVMLTSISRSRLTGLGATVAAGIRLSESESTDAEGNVTRQTVDVNRNARTSLATTTRSGVATPMTENTVNGFSISITSFDGLTVTKGYDSLLRPNTVKDSRNNTTTSAYIAGTTLVQSVTNQAGNTSVTAYDNMGRVITQRDPKNHRTRYGYTAKGQLWRQWGDGAVPVEYGYDETYGDRTTMKTFRGGTGWDTVAGDGSNAANPWPASPGTADTTTWTYDGPSGLLTTKTDALGRAVAQTYNLRGQTATRTLARNVVTSYGYDGATGELLSQTYSDSTPAVTYTYDRTGQVGTIADVTGTRDLIYDSNKPWRLAAEAHSSFYGDRVMSRLYDESTTGFIGRVRGFQLGTNTSSNADLEQTFGFTTVGRFETIATSRSNDGGTLRRFRYGYLANSALLQSLAIDQGAGPGGHPFTVTCSYESQRNLVTAIDSKWSTTTLTGYAYDYDERGQRSKVVQSGSAFGDYGDSTSQQFAYNGRGELTAAIGYLGSDITQANKQLPGWRLEYGYDPAGNRQWSNRTGNTTLRDDYTTNALNQYTTRENNTLPLSGTAEPDPGGAGGTAVSVQGGTLTPVAAGRQGRYWNDEVTVNNNANPNSPNPWRGPLTIFTAKRGTSGSPDVYRVDSRMAEIAARLQTFTYDNDGNLLSDGIVDYQWDAENRLVRMETTSMARTWGFAHRLLEFRYDYMGRRVQKRVVDVTQEQEISCRRFLYDGWNLIAEYAAPGGSVCGALLRSYTWGLDIVSSTTSAGGVGALLQIADHPSGKTYLPTYDGNGNIAALLNAATGALAACYEYSPYGEPLRAQTLDATVADNPFRFSTKWTDLETGLVYYGHRYYEPKNGRFINRDPIEEAGGLNLYGFCGNNAINRWDLLGHSYNVTEHQSVAADGTHFISFFASATDASGNYGEWNFSSKADAERWAQAWVDHDMSVVGDRAVTDEYLAAVEEPPAFARDYGLPGDAAFVSAGIQYTLIGMADDSGQILNYVDSHGSVHQLVNNYYTWPIEEDGASGGGMFGGIGTFAFTIDGFSAGSIGQTEAAQLQLLAHYLGGSNGLALPAFTRSVGPAPSVFLSPGVVTPAAVTNPAAGTSITVNGYGTLTISSSGADGGRQAMTFTPTNGQSASDFAFIQYVTNDPQNNQRSPYNGGGNVPYLDAPVGYNSPYLNPTGYYQDNPFNPNNPGTYNNGTPVYSNGGINFYDHPQTTGGAPVGFQVYLIDRNTGTILQPIRWGINGGPGP